MPGGRPPKPTRLKVLQGNPGKRPLPDNEPQPPPGKVRPPAWLAPRSSARRLWHRLAPKLERMGVLTTADLDSLALLCDTYAEFLELRDYLQANGRTYSTTTAAGDPMIRPRPELAQLNESRRQLRALMATFGLEPSSRSKLSVAPREEDDPLAAFLARRRRR